MSVISTPLSRKSRPTWWKTPQRVWLRRALFQVHLWVGLFLTLYVVVIGLSGSALVFRPELENVSDGAALHVPSQPAQTSLDRIVASIRKRHPECKPAGLEDLNRPDHAWTLLMLPGRAAPDYRLVSFNPYSGQVLLDRMRFDGALGWLANLHFYLLAGRLGLAVSGDLAIGLLVLCVSGLVLWWPGVRRWTSALLLRRRARWQRLTWDLHSVVGFWSGVALTLLTVTGIYFAFPAPVARLVSVLTGDRVPAASNPAKSSKQRPQTLSTVPLSTVPLPTMTLAQALDAARHALPPEAPPSYLQLPAEPGAPYQVTGYYTNTAPYSQWVAITLDPKTGAVLARNDTRQQPIGQRVVSYFFTIHAGSFAGPGWPGLLVKALWMVLGLVPPLLAITGALMYWNRSLSRCFSTRSTGSKG